MEGKITYSQGKWLYVYTGHKFWEPQQNPAPKIEEASKLLDLIFAWTKTPKEKKKDMEFTIVDIIRKWFPEFDLKDLHYRSKKETTPEKKTEKPVEKKELPKDKPIEKIPDQKVIPDKTNNCNTMNKLQFLIQSGIYNIFMAGPAGCGKTTLAKMVSAQLNLPCTIWSCNAGSSPAEFIGFNYPSPRPSPVSSSLGMEGIIVLDEFTTLDPAVACIVNSFLANGEVETTTGHVVRHKNLIVIATANTLGQGADRMYIANNQLDAATLDRFCGGFLQIDYDNTYERSICNSQIYNSFTEIRKICKELNIRRVVSTRAMISGQKLFDNGMKIDDIITQFLIPFTDEEKKQIKGRVCEQ
jgi:MoxR-like ATPase